MSDSDNDSSGSPPVLSPPFNACWFHGRVGCSKGDRCTRSHDEVDIAERDNWRRGTRKQWRGRERKRKLRLIECNKAAENLCDEDKQITTPMLSSQQQHSSENEPPPPLPKEDAPDIWSPQPRPTTYAYPCLAFIRGQCVQTDCIYTHDARLIAQWYEMQMLRLSEINLQLRNQIQVLAASSSSPGGGTSKTRQFLQQQQQPLPVPYFNETGNSQPSTSNIVQTRPPCIYFRESGGCRNGFRCKFLHLAPPPQHSGHYTPLLSNHGIRFPF